jgi:threonine dehydrogenase-like Zn-dependent dehydrogenase
MRVSGAQNHQSTVQILTSYVSVLGYFPQDFRSIIDAIESKTLQPEKMITSKIRIDRLVEDGFTPLVDEKDKHVKILVDLTSSH